MFHSILFSFIFVLNTSRGRRDRDHMVVGFTTTCVISAYHHESCEFEPFMARCDNVQQ